jgi:hypothetical protein
MKSLLSALLTGRPKLCWTVIQRIRSDFLLAAFLSATLQVILQLVLRIELRSAYSAFIGLARFMFFGHGFTSFRNGMFPPQQRHLRVPPGFDLIPSFLPRLEESTSASESSAEFRYNYVFR